MYKYSYNLALHFESICQQHACDSAIFYPDKSYSYEQLNLHSNKIAHLLLSQGIKRGDVLAIISDKRYETYALIVACLKLGIIYTKIDPDSPSERLKNIVETCRPARVFTDHGCSSKLIDTAVSCGIMIEDIPLFCSPECEVDVGELASLSQSIDGDAIAYIMFTSGSTGKPKGVAITHQNLLHFINWGVSYYHISSKDRIANINPIYFDNAVFDIYMSLFSGACLVPIKKDIVSSAKLLVDFVDETKCTILFSVPSLFIYLNAMKVLNLNNFTSVRVITFGGEGFPKSELKKIYDLYSSRTRFVNVYGPTECTCICSHYEISDDDFKDMTGLPPLGYINQNFSYLIISDGIVSANQGELCLLGPNVGRGYYNNSDSSDKVFIEYTGHGFYKSRMYCTGDIVHLKNGLLYFSGRVDNQIKHMGYRIELEEIELAINSIPEVIQAAAVYKKESDSHGKIIAYIASNHAIDAKYIRDKICNILPTYMLPNTVIVLNQLPKNQNGKVDKLALSMTAMA